MATSISGFCDDRFDAVRDAFVQNFEQRAEIGASVAVVLEGNRVVDLWGGTMDTAQSQPWEEDTLVNVWSLGKAMTALAMLKLMETGKVRATDRVSSVWPGFEAGGKTSITFEMALSHQAGLAGIEAPLPARAYYDWDLMTRALEAQTPWWEPGTAHGYHTNTFGFLIGEPIRRLTGMRLRDWFQQEIAGPLGVDFFMGVPTAQLGRCADLIHSPRPPDSPSPADPRDEEDETDRLFQMRKCIYGNPSLGDYDFNSTDWRTAEFPSTSPQSNARSVATVFGELAEIAAGKRDGIISREMLDDATTTRSDGDDLNVGRPTRFGLGFQLTQPVRPLGPSPNAFGHYGNGGHVGFADPEARIGFAYHMNHQGYAWRDPRNIALIDAVYESL